MTLPSMLIQRMQYTHKIFGEVYLSALAWEGVSRDCSNTEVC